jgi:hypothetical protein
MIPPHTSVKFKFNEDSKLWFDIHCASIIKNFDEKFPESGGPIFNSPGHDDAVAFQLSPPAVQVKKFLNDLGLTNTYVHMFVYKVQSKTISIENPHIDTPGMQPLPGRFNVLVYGNENSKMHWWDRDVHHPAIQFVDVPNFGKRWQVIGDTMKEKFDLIGPPDYSADNLSKFDQTGDFVRTDIVHSIERDGERRLIVSARIHHPWEEILEKTKQ